MTDFKLKRRAVRNFPILRDEDRVRVKSLRRQWVRSVRELGDNWLMLRPVTRKVPA